MITVYPIVLSQVTSLNLFQPNVVLHKETSHLICTTNEVTSLYMKCNTGFKIGQFLSLYMDFFMVVLKDASLISIYLIISLGEYV